MAITRGQKSSVGAAATTSTTCTFGTNPTAGNAILVAVGSFNGVTATVTDNASPSSNTYTTCTDGTHTAKETGGSILTQIFKADNLKLPSSGSLVLTISVTSSGATIGFAEEIIGATTGNVEFAAIATGSTQPMLIASGGGSTDDLYWGMSSDTAGSATVTYTYGNSFVQEGFEGDNSAFQDMSVASLGFGGGTSGSQTYSATSSPTNTFWIGTIVAIKPAAGGAVAVGGPKVPDPYTLLRPGHLYTGPMALRLQTQHFQARHRTAGTAAAVLNLQTLAVSTTTTPAIVKQIGKQVAISTTTSPSILKQVGKALTVSTATALSIVRQIGKVLAVSTTTTPAILKQIAKFLVVSTTTVPSVVTAKLKLVLLAVSTTTTAALTKQVGKLLAVSSTTVPTFTKFIGKLLTVSSTTTPVLSALKAKFITLAVSTTTVPAIVKQVGKQLVVSTTTAPSLLKQIGKLLVRSTTTVPAVLTTKVKLVLLAVSTTTVPTISRQVARAILLAVSTTTVPTLTKSVSKVLGAATATQAAIQKRITKTLATTTTTVPAVAAVILSALTGKAVSSPTKVAGRVANTVLGIFGVNRTKGGGPNQLK